MSNAVETPCEFALVVRGVPQPAGSKKAIPCFNRHSGKYVTAANGRPIVSVVDDAKHSRDWKSRITALARQMRPPELLDGPLALEVLFVMPRPRSHYGTGKNATTLKADAPVWHTSKPDATKLLRAVEDALNGVVWVDDARVVCQTVRKEYGLEPGVRIEVRRLERETVR